MATKTLHKIVLVFICSLIETVRGYYCDNDRCLEEEFCCGENICCVSYKVWELWYFWCGILFFLFLLSMCACFWRQRSRAYWVFRTPVPYSPLSPEEDANYIKAIQYPVGDVLFNSLTGTGVKQLPDTQVGHPDPYVTGLERSVSPRSFYGPAPMKAQGWYSPHTGHQVNPPPYTDAPLPYDTGSQKKAAFE